MIVCDDHADLLPLFGSHWNRAHRTLAEASSASEPRGIAPPHDCGDDMSRRADDAGLILRLVHLDDCRATGGRRSWELR